jgi:hypothetical protein
VLEQILGNRFDALPKFHFARQDVPKPSNQVYHHIVLSIAEAPAHANRAGSDLATIGVNFAS